jgi:hypothetical protein
MSAFAYCAPDAFWLCASQEAHEAVEALDVTRAFCAQWNERIHRLDATLQSFAPQTEYPYVFTPQAAENKQVLLPARRGVW